MSYLSIFINILIFFTLIACLATFSVYFERKMAAWVQDRIGPSQTGYRGILQPLADILKLVNKQILRPKLSSFLLYYLSPCLSITFVISPLFFIPIFSATPVFSSPFSLLIIALLISLKVLATLCAGISTSSKLSLLGSMRSVSQIISYEIPFWLIIISFAVWYETFDIVSLQVFQNTNPIAWLTGYHDYFKEHNFQSVITTYDILNWSIVRMPLFILSFFVYILCALALCNRTPFDLAESESELVGGFHTEYGGFLFSLFFLAEYGLMFLLSVLASLLFFGGGSLVFVQTHWYVLGIDVFYFLILLSKSLLIYIFMLIIRWVLPRYRYDRWILISWKLLLPLSLIILIMVILFKLLIKL